MPFRTSTSPRGGFDRTVVQKLPDMCTTIYGFLLFLPHPVIYMSEILQGLELRAQALGDAEQATPVVDMRSARLTSIVSGSTDSEHLPHAIVTPTHLEMGEDIEVWSDVAASLDTDNDEGLDVKGLLKQLLTFPRATNGIVPDTWGIDKRAEVKRLSTDTDSVYTLDRGHHSTT